MFRSKGHLQKDIIISFTMLLLQLVKIHNIYIYDMVIVVSILLKMVILTETCKGWKIKKNATFINHTGRWLKILYTITSVTNQNEPS
jgi:hypothetical protein